MKIWIFIVKFLLIGSLFIVSNNQLYLSEAEDRQEFYSLFQFWFESLVSKVGDIGGYVVKSEWLPGGDINKLLKKAEK